MEASFWQSYELSDEQCRCWRLGPLSLYLRRGMRELLLAAVRDDDEDREPLLGEVAEPPDGLDWQRWAVMEDSPRIALKPAFADRPLVVRPESPLTIPPGVECLFYTMMPLSIEVVLEGSTPQTLCVVPVMVLSNTWFGEDTMKGELCYAMRTTARRRLASAPPRPHRAICPILVSNESEQPVECLRICLRVDHMSLYRHQGQFWTSEVIVRHREREFSQQLEYAERVPDGVALTDVVLSPRTVVRGGLWRHSIGTIGLTSWFRSD